MLYIHTSNRLEHLSTVLAYVLSQPLADPLARETIVIQSLGMSRWLSMSLAEKLGVWANADFPFPEAIVWRIFRSVLPQLPDTSKFKREVMTWSLVKLLPEFIDHPDFKELNHYLTDDQHGVKLFQLASRIADVFDQYVIFRSDNIATWENDEQPLLWLDPAYDSYAQWQKILWQALANYYDHHSAHTKHRAALKQQFFDQLEKQIPTLGLPQRLSIFGVSSLPPFHLEIILSLSHFIDVHVFALNPCQEYWGDIISRSALAKLEKHKPEQAAVFESGNSLLASMGMLGRDFIDMLGDEANKFPHHYKEYFEPADNHTLLAYIQNDILQLEERGDTLATTLIDETDKSIQFHVCYSPMREIEVLHDQLLALFAQHDDLQPKDIVVMMPNVEVYAPFIQAVFSSTEKEEKYLPYTIADRSLRQQSELIEAFFAILELEYSRFTTNDILDLLDFIPIQQKFDLNLNELELIQHWVKETGICWGVDADSRSNLDLPSFAENTWDAGLKRLLLGYALPAHEKAVLFHDIVPFDDIEGQDAQILGKFMHFIDHVVNTVNALKTPRTLSDWKVFLLEVLENFLTAEEEYEYQLQRMRDTLASLEKNADEAYFSNEISSRVLLTYLRHHLETDPLPMHFLTGHITFCALLPMRSIPFRVICLLGINDKDYPRADDSVNFNLIKVAHERGQRQRGDRSQRLNDRYLFLEAVLSARDYCYISYVGRNIHNDSIQPPSVLVSELQDYIETGFIHPSQNLLTSLTTYHPLQAFSPDYFSNDNTHLFSYSSTYYAASQTLAAKQNMLDQPVSQQHLINTQLPEANQEQRTISVQQLLRFLRHPVKFLLQQRLGVQLIENTVQLPVTEPFTVDALDRYQLHESVTHDQLTHRHTQQQHYAMTKASGHLPHGEVGKFIYNKEFHVVQPFINEVQQLLSTQHKLTPHLIQEMHFEELGLTITGTLDNLWSNAYIYYHCSRLKAKHFLEAWIHHLLLNSINAVPPLPRFSRLLGLDSQQVACTHYVFEPLKQEEAKQYLSQILAYYWQGLHSPLYFFPETSLSFVQETQNPKNTKKTEMELLKKALQTKWVIEGDKNSYQGESSDAYYQLCFHEPEHLLEDEEAQQQFIDVSKMIFEPLLDHLKLEDEEE